MFGKGMICGLILAFFTAASSTAANEPVTLARFLEDALASHSELIEHEFALMELQANLDAAKMSSPALNMQLGYSKLNSWHPAGSNWAARASFEGRGRFGSEYSISYDFRGKAMQIQLALPVSMPREMSPRQQQVAACEYSYQKELIASQVLREEVFLAAAKCFLNIWRLKEAVNVRQAMITWLDSQLEILAEACHTGIAHEIDLACVELQYQMQINSIDVLREQLAAERSLAVMVYGMASEADLLHEPAQFDPKDLEFVLVPQPAAGIAMAKLDYGLAEMHARQLQTELGAQGRLSINLNSDSDWSVEWAVQIPLFDQAYRENQVDAADAKLSQTALAVERAELETICEHIYRQLHLSAASSNLKTVVQARELAARQKEIAAEQYEKGLLSFIELLRAWEGEAAAFLDLVDAEFEYQLAQIQHWLLDSNQNCE